LALDGSKQVTDVEFVTDTFTPLADRDITLNSIAGAYAPSSVPDGCSTVTLLGLGFAALAGLRRRLKLA
jgi:hypothetical protein